MHARVLVLKDSLTREFGRKVPSAKIQASKVEDNFESSVNRKAASGTTPEPSCPMKLSISSIVVSDVLDRSICSFNGTDWVESRYALDVFAEMVETGVVDGLIQTTLATKPVSTISANTSKASQLRPSFDSPKIKMQKLNLSGMNSSSRICPSKISRSKSPFFQSPLPPSDCAKSLWGEQPEEATIIEMNEPVWRALNRVEASEKTKS
ncbi:hypothetical protein ACLOJK_003989 [Asimina triloba]